VKKRRKERRKPRSYSMEFRLEAVTRLLAGESSRGLSRRLDVRTSVLYRWLDKYRQVALQRMGGGEIEAAIEKTSAELARQRVAELEQKVGRQALELDFLRRAFERVKDLRQPNTGCGASASTRRSGR
jgi:transposase-like protein